MEHSYIEEHNITDRYLLGKLSSEERTRFEEHFADCTQCLDQLETAADFRDGLRVVAAKEALRRRAYLRTGRAGWRATLARFGRARQVALFTGVTLLISAPLTALVVEWMIARRDLTEMTRALSQWRRESERGERLSLDLIKEMQDRERQLSLQRQQLAAELELERKERMRLADSLNNAFLSQAVPVFAMSAERSAEPDLSQPVNRITLSSSSRLFVLLLELTPDPNFQSYRASISTSDGWKVWMMSNLKPNSDDVLALGLSSRLFKSGAYTLTLEKLTMQKRYELIAKYSFRLLTQ